MRSARRLIVQIYGTRAGVLERSGGSITFAYDEDYLATSNPTPLSLAMPLATTRYTNKFVEAYLRGLLPDNDDVRRRWAVHFGLKDRDTFGLIAAIGNDAAGGAVFIPEDDYPAAVIEGRVDPIDEPGIARRLRRLRVDDSDWLGDDEHWSLAGAQSKFTLRKTEAGWGIAHGGEPSTHIVKPGITRIPGQALVEHISMLALAGLGLDVAHTEYMEFEDQSAIVVERFDRRLRDSGWHRIHQEDLCQTFALDPLRKYERDGGPGVRRIAELLASATTDEGSVERFTRAVIANHLLGAPDAHAKNYSILLAGRAVQLAPLYDVASGLTSERDGKLRYPTGAMSLGGESAFGDVYSDNWDKFAGSAGQSQDQVRAWVKDYAEDLPDALSDAVHTISRRASESAMLPTLVERVQALSSRTLRNLDTRITGRRPKATGATALVAGLGTQGRVDRSEELAVESGGARPPSGGEVWNEENGD